MSSSNNSNSSAAGGGIGFVGLLTIVFITLKLIGKITWSWLWVLSPIWISTGLGLLIVVIVGIVCIISYLVKKSKLKKKYRPFNK